MSEISELKTERCSGGAKLVVTLKPYTFNTGAVSYILQHVDLKIVFHFNTK